MGSLRLLAASLVSCLVAVLCCAGSALAGEPESFGGSGLAAGPLVIPEAEFLLGGEQLRAQREVDLENPVAVNARTASRTRFAHMSASGAIKLASSVFPAIVNRPAGGPPSLPAGEKIDSYIASNAARVTLPGGKHELIESLQPIAKQSGPGRFRPLDLALRRSGDGYAPATSDVGVQIPTRLSSGVSMPGDGGITLTPVDSSGRPLEGSTGTLDGASVLYANTQTDADTLAKPITGGFEIDSLLRSADSPEVLYFKVGMPVDARLMTTAVKGKAIGPNQARVVLQGRTLAVLATPSAQDAGGTEVPVKTNVTNDTLTVTVARDTGKYQYPIAVDPRAYDSTLGIPSTQGTNWEFYANPSGKFESYGASEGSVMRNIGSIGLPEHDEFRYPAHGQSSVTYIEEESTASAEEESAAITKLEFAHESTIEEQYTLASAGQSYGRSQNDYGDQVVEEAGEGEGIKYGFGAEYHENEVRIMQTATKEAAEGYGFWFQLYKATVGVLQEKGPEVSFSKTEPTVAEAGGRENVLYSGGGWLGEYNGAVEFTAKDPGLGISHVTIKDLTAGPGGVHWSYTDAIYGEHYCTGVWCAPEFKKPFTYNKEMAEGSNTFELCAEDQALMKACTTTTVDVDNTPPRNIQLKGMAEVGAELSAAQHQITVEATDGTAPTASSGIKSISASIDGNEIGIPSGSCGPGECTGSATFMIPGENFGAGEHKLRVKVTDNANNVASEKVYTFGIRNAAQMSLGPGTIDPETGRLALTATDADVAGVGAVSRTYLSRSPSAGIEGPLGPQWSLSVGSAQTLNVLPDGNVEVLSVSGARTTFKDEAGNYIAPPGDSSQTLTSWEEEPGKGITEYTLGNPASGGVTKFKLIAGAHTWTETGATSKHLGKATKYYYTLDERPTEYSLHAGSQPISIADGSDGNLWVTQPGSEAISKVTTGGAVTEYKMGPKDSCPTDIVPGPGGELASWFTVSCDDIVGRISTAGATTTYKIIHSGGTLQGIATGPEGNLWFAICSESKIGKITPSGIVTEYSLPAGSDPTGIVEGPNSDMWFTERGTNKIGEISPTTGERKEYGVATGSEPYGITSGPTKSLWFVDAGTSKVVKMSTSGGATEYSLPAGSDPRGITVGPGNDLWFTDYGTSKIGKITTAGTISEYALPSGSEPSGIVKGPDENIWYTDYGTNKVGVLRPIIKPTGVIGPIQENVECGSLLWEIKIEELKAGCRALTFTYTEAGKSTATGEAPSGWGEYERQLAKVSITAYNPATKAMQTTTIAQYSYDSQGRLRAEWDPRIESSTACGKTCSALKATYGYDAEGHVTAYSPPGQQPWLFHYGITTGDPTPGRLLSLTRPGASTSFGNGSAPANTAAPTLSSASPVIGTTLNVATNGTWSNSSLAYSYQWEDCNSSGKECTPILGAVNQSYTPQARDGGYALVAQVSAQNAGGMVTAATAASKIIPLSAPTYSTSFGSHGSEKDQFSGPTAIAFDGQGNIYVPDFENNRIEEFNSSRAFIKAVGFGVSDGKSELETCTTTCRAGIAGSANGQFDLPSGIAINQETGAIYVADTGNNRVEEFSSAWAFTSSFGGSGSGPGQMSNPSGDAIDPSGKVWVADYKNHRVEEFSAGGAFIAQFGESQLGIGAFGPGTVTASEGRLYVNDYDNNRIVELSDAGKYITQFGSSGTGPGQFSNPLNVAIDPTTGDIFVSDGKNGRVEIFNKSGTYLTEFGKAGTGSGQFQSPDGIAITAQGSIYIADEGNNRVQQWSSSYSTNNPAPSPPTAGTSAITTVEYHVALSGSGAPNQMTSTELAKWGQKSDLPTEATAIFPPDEPMGWPAADYKRATITYMDSEARTTNTATPSGGISTVEYNSANELTRALSATNRATALKEGSKSAEVAEALSSTKIYNAEGTQLLETYGPEHKVKVPGGAEEESRDREQYTYNEGMPSKETDDLVTTSVGWVETTSKKVLEKHETKLSYGGQNQLGWELRKPTQLGTEIKGQKTIKTITYEPGTGEPTETQTSASLAAPTYASQFGSSGSGTGQFKTPSAAALDSHGDLWVVDRGNNRVEEFTSLGQLVAAYGTEGTGALQFKAPEGVAINPSTGNVYVTDSGNNRVEELSAEGKFVATYGFGVSNGEAKYETCTSSCRAGTSGSGSGQFNDPLGVAVDTSGNVWVVDRNNDRVEKFSSANGFLAAYGAKGAGELQFNEPAYVAVAGGRIYITDSGNSRVEKISSSGVYVGAFGSSGSGGGQFGHPDGIAANPNTGMLYVGDPANSRVEQFSETGAYLTQFGTVGSGNGQLKEPVGIAADGFNDIYVVDSGNSRVDMWERLAPAPVYSAQFAHGDFNDAVNDAIDSHGNIWVTNYYGSNVQEFAPSGSRIGSYMTVGAGIDQVKHPTGVAVNETNNDVYIGDSENNRIDELNEKGEFVAAFGYGVSDGLEKLEVCTTSCRAGLVGGHAGEFHEVSGLAVDTAGNVWASDEFNNRVQEFNSKDEFQRTFGFGVRDGKSEFEVCTSGCQAGSWGSGSGQLESPTGIVVNAGHVYVSDTYNSRIQVFSSEGAYVSQFGSSGSGNGQLNEPDGLATDQAGNLYVADTKNSRIEEFTAAGTYLRTIADKGSGNGQVSEAAGVALDANGDLYVVDGENNRVEEWAAAPNPGNEGADNIRTIYYTAAANAEYPSCGGHPEWASLIWGQRSAGATGHVHDLQHVGRAGNDHRKNWIRDAHHKEGF